jgi:site-specific recombinase
MQKIAIFKDKVRRKLSLCERVSFQRLRYENLEGLKLLASSVRMEGLEAKLNEIPLNLLWRNSAKYAKTKVFKLKLHQRIKKKDTCNLLKPTGHVMHQQV